jgi:transcriptional regulator with XRE-family HTH domain
MSSQASTDARKEFARRLRELRINRGYKTARSLATALAIDENRYTRYERAEVEPDIGLIQRICATLELSPNELFGTAREMPPASAAAGFAEIGKGYAVGRDGRARATWLLACAVAELQTRVEPAGKRHLARLQQTARLFTDLERRSFAAVSEILLLPAVSHAAPDEVRYIGRLVEELSRPSA